MGNNLRAAMVTHPRRRARAPRILVLLASLTVLIAMLLGYTTQHPSPRLPMDSGTPAEVTTIGGGW